MKRSLALCAVALAAAPLTAQCSVAADLTAGNVNNGNIGEMIAAFGNELYFAGFFPQTGGELWKWTPSGGAQIVADLAPGAANTNPTDIAACLTKNGPRVFFRGFEIGHGHEVYATDGTAAGTGRVREIFPGSTGSMPYGFCASGGLVYFNAVEAATGEELWVSDGTTAGTQRLSDFAPGAAHGRPRRFFAFEGRVVFEAFSPATGRELFVSDGTTAGTGLLRDINPGTAHSNPDGFVRFGDDVYFIASTANEGREIWRTDGTTAGTVLMDDVFPPNSFGPHDLTVCGDNLYFHEATGSGGGPVWVTDGTIGGATNLTGQFVDGRYLTASGDLVFFQGTTSSTGAEPWVTNGSPTATQRIVDLDPSGSSFAQQFVACGAGVMFVASVTTGGELWFSDGTAAGTTHVCTLDPGGNAAPLQLTMCQGQLLFEAYSPSVGRELFRVQTPGATRALLAGASGPDWSSLTTADCAVPILGTTVDIEGHGPTGHAGFLLAGGPALPVPAPILPGVITGGQDWVGLQAGTAISVATVLVPDFTVPFVIPNVAAFEGLNFQFQTLWVNFVGAPTLQLSNGLQLTVGSAAPH